LDDLLEISRNEQHGMEGIVAAKVMDGEREVK
jgi:hypothetical protein